ncbi:hypothetical protein Tco_1047803 [Tanacetum coccineum]
MLAIQVVEGEGSGQPSKPRLTPSPAPPSQEEQVHDVATSHPQKTQTPRQAKKGRDIEIPQSSGPPEKVGDKAVHKELGDRVQRAATTATSLDAECQEAIGGTIAQTRSERVPTPSYDSPLLGGNTPGSDEERLKQHELTDFVPPTPLDSPLSEGHTPGSDKDLVINKLKKKVKRLEKKQRERTLGMKLFKIGTSRRKSLDNENASEHGRNLKTRPMFEDDDFNDNINDMVNEVMENVKGDTFNAIGAVNTATTRVSAGNASVTTAGVSISTAEPRTPPTTTTIAFEDEDLTIAQIHVKMRSEKAKVKGVDFKDVEESARSTTILPTIDPKDKGKGIMQEPEKPPKNPIKAQIQRDAEIAQRLFEEEQAQFEREQRIARERAAE